MLGADEGRLVSLHNGRLETTIDAVGDTLGAALGHDVGDILGAALGHDVGDILGAAM